MSRFQTLMRREWMQYRRGWSITLLVPPLLLLLLTAVGHVDLPRPFSPSLLMLGAAALCTFGALVLFSFVTWLQIPGLACRDREDRSIEFWLSLPVGHAASVAAPLVMHLLVMPLVALGVGFLFGQVVGVVALVKTGAAGAWAEVPWSALIGRELLALASFAFGAVVATFWLSPLLLSAMAASAWLKRWGIAALTVTLSIAHVVLSRLYGIDTIAATVHALVGEAMRALLNQQDLRLTPHDAASAAAWLQDAPQWLAQDALAVAGRLIQPLALFVVVASAACFALLVLRRRRNG